MVETAAYDIMNMFDSNFWLDLGGGKRVFAVLPIINPT